MRRFLNLAPRPFISRASSAPSLLIVAGTALMLAGCGPKLDGETDMAVNGSSDISDNAVFTPVMNEAGPVGKAPAPASSSDAKTPQSVPAQTGADSARIPLINATCGSGIEVHADAGGPVFIDGTQAALKKFNDKYFEASHAGTTVSIAFESGPTPSLSYTGPNRANGVCRLN